MKGIILAGGTGSRLGSLSKVTNKHLLPVGFVPMIYHPLSQLLYNGIRDICIVSGLFHLGSVVSLLGSGKKFNCEFTYKVQDEAGGIAEALNLCKSFANDEDMAVFLGDNIFEKPIKLNLNNNDAVFYLKKVKDPKRFGIAEVDHMKKLIDIEEKPENPKSNFAITGVYIYSSIIWNAIGSTSRSNRGELEISDANKWIIKNGKVSTFEVDGWWSDAGTKKSYKESNKLVWSKLDNELLEIIKGMCNE
jgi:glucose-1-phosphate thymidylyltransferase